ncbi:hypothetical protein [Streptomyces sp. NRRL WC-3742]|uniref:hypothetical protein n=1 Tax=Streptomyces sp. NRRL WC-3742 TaxID=1463934 RepID=UPI0004C5A249|nr:hypothetical protein [Streptomyces sp. NRRL WC-3742]
MAYLWGEAIRWVDDEPQPGMVEVRFADVDGARWSIIAKTPCFGTHSALGPDSWIEEDSPFPFPVEIECTVLNAIGTGDDEVVTVSFEFPHYLEILSGRNEFRVGRHQLGED